MPYCSQCGTQLRDEDVFCGRCGARQPVSAAAPAYDGFNPRTASILCYIPFVGWIAAIIVLASARFRQDAGVRFHAFQGIYLFVVWLLVDMIMGPVMGFTRVRGWGTVWVPALSSFAFVGVLKAVVVVAWIVMLIKASRGEQYRLPILGELAERSVAEQK
ncbi:MAG: zinc-ribbon domain-containing protein [Bryobacterales bacterium]|nr:zinc-ribbon domain-containing protein [Bryobacterales bacterium]